MYLSSKPVFLFSILGIGAGLSELGKLARKLWKLGKVETCKRTSNTKEFILRTQYYVSITVWPSSLSVQQKQIKNVHVCTEFLTLNFSRFSK